MKKREVGIILKGFGKVPFYATEFSSGADIYAANSFEVVIPPGAIVKIPTGIHLELPIDAECTIRPRSGLSIKKHVVAILGTIDADYQGEVGVILQNFSTEPFIVKRGERIAQMSFNGEGGLFQAIFTQMDKFTRPSERGEGGFGHTGV